MKDKTQPEPIIKVEVDQKLFQKIVERVEEIGKKVDSLIFAQSTPKESPLKIAENPMPVLEQDKFAAPNVSNPLNIIAVTLRTQGTQPEKVELFIKELNVLIERFEVLELTVKYKR